MPINFEEVSAEVVPETPPEGTSAPAQENQPAGQDPAECFRRELQLHRERERRRAAD